jgi:hypothetical protein
VAAVHRGDVAQAHLIDVKKLSAAPGRRIVRAPSTPVVTRRLAMNDSPDSLSRKRTAQMLRELRALTSQVKMLRAQIDEEERSARTPRVVRRRGDDVR